MEYMESLMQDQIEGGISANEELHQELHRQKELLAWAYSKLSCYSLSSIDDALTMDEIKLLLEHGV